MQRIADKKEPDDRPVRGVYRADDEPVLRQRELAVRRILQAHRLITVLQQEVQLAEHLGQVRPGDLINDQNIRGTRVGLSYLGEVA